ncbi:hypothetical protein C4546_03575 [Candidatus Parcubacteria bacterium]|jgi:N-formylglutamate amidohydrolase|nr:MAG: hypothetical protein C4546_03575 [Candidatus Parcubacteria bacterium]
MNEREDFHYLANEARREKQEQATSVINFMAEQGLPSQEVDPREMLSGNEAVETRFEPLRKKDPPNIIYGVPHAGEYAPKELYEKMTDEGRETLTLIDPGTNRIFRSDKIASVETKMSRFIVDPNRAPDFTPDNQTVAGKPPGKILWKEGVRFGPMYQPGQEPNENEIQELAEKYYLPYYNAMMSGIGSLADRRESQKERILVIDGHSFPITENMEAYFKHYQIAEPEKMPMFILGTRDGEACDADILEAFAEALEENFENLPFAQKELIKASIRGKIVGTNEYLKGVHNVKFYGAREQGINAIQVECNESAYIDREEIPGKSGYQRWASLKYNDEKMNILQGLIERSALAVNNLLKAKS